jgi:hypothetical protein
MNLCLESLQQDLEIRKGLSILMDLEIQMHQWLQ